MAGPSSGSSSCFKEWFCGGSCLSHGGEDTNVWLQSLWPRILVLDGGVSTHLEEMLLQQQQQQQQEQQAVGGGGSLSSDSVVVATASVFPYRELWSSGLLLNERGRALILQGHLDWMQAGANVLSTVTYQCHYEQSLWPPPDPTTGQSLLTDHRMDQMWKDGMALARRAAAATDPPLFPRAVPTFVVASSGCYGAALANGAEYTGNYYYDGLDHDDDDDDTSNDNNLTDTKRSILQEFHRRKLQTAVRLRPDGIAVETIPSLVECQAIRDLLQSDELGLLLDAGPVACYVSLACRNGCALHDGTPLQTALNVFRTVPVSRLQAVGLNCCDGRHLHGLLSILVQDLATITPISRRGIVIYPNSGELWDAETQQWTAGTGVTADSAMANQLMQNILHIEDTWRQHHTTTSDTSTPPLPSILIGGCCRTQPATIKALRTLVDAHLATRE